MLLAFNSIGKLFPVFAFGITATSDTFRAKCNSLRPEAHVPAVKTTRLEYVPAKTNLSLPYNDASCARSSQFVHASLCKVAMSVSTSHQSDIIVEMWLPEVWNGRFLATGNGGVDGCIKYEDLAYGARNGFATVGANNGHNGTTLLTAFNNDDVVIDFAHRSLHTATQVGKRLTKEFYNKPHQKSYYIGCSLGGRQGIDAVDKYPYDFDGVVAGAPAIDFNNLCSWRASFFPLTGVNTSADFIQSDSWRTWIHDEVLRQCDSLDGAVDGIIEDPSLCNFDPSQLLCTSALPHNCLTETQVRIIHAIYSSYTYADGRLIYPGMQPGNEIVAATGLYSGTPFSSSVDWFKYVVLSNKSWDPATYSLKDAKFAEAQNAADIRTWPSDLTDFRLRGGKLLIHHGQQDDKISSYNTPRFYKHLQEGTQLGHDEMDKWVRFFRISGMNHCNSGPGAWVFGQGGNTAADGIGFSPDSNVLAAMVDWVEAGIAPETILGTKFLNDSVAAGVQLQRRHCKWPSRNLFLTGDPNQANNWHCTSML